jgi:Zn-dependent protease
MLLEKNPEWDGGIIWVTSVVAGVLFFAAILVHELAHSLVAKARGLVVRSITLFALGGVSQIDEESPDARTEFWISIVGPLSIIAIGLLFPALALVGLQLKLPKIHF